NKDGNSVNKDSGINAHEKSANSIDDVNTIGPSINTASTDFDTGRLNINIVSPTVSTASPKATHADFLGRGNTGRATPVQTTKGVDFGRFAKWIKEEVYVCQPLGFKDPDHSNKVYKVVKALYGLHQALRA
nr:reverse transcriptase [Tanacetum cinerariifolium]